MQPESHGTDVAHNLVTVRQRIEEACRKSGRSAHGVTLIAVSKSQPRARIEAALAAGQCFFGENYVQEAAGRWPELRQMHDSVELHLIGSLQSNKAAEAVRLFDVIQTLDRPRLAAALAREFARQDVTRRLFIEVNTGGEPQKAGIRPLDLDAFVAACRREFELPIEGLMAIPPASEDVGRHTVTLAALAARNGLSALSVGMSSDFEIAIRSGATHVRVGTSIFGARPLRS